jgi:hypothetical protein
MAGTASTDKELGLGLLFGVVALVGALLMYVAAVGHDQVLSGWGFAAAMVAGGLAVLAIHLY